MEPQQIEQVRRFNRLVTQRTGALDHSYLRRGRPLGEARVLHEVGRDGADVAVLRVRLGLDSGYLSRLLRSLEAQGLVRVSRQAGDARRRVVGLTRKGRTELPPTIGCPTNSPARCCGRLAQRSVSVWSPPWPRSSG